MRGRVRAGAFFSDAGAAWKRAFLGGVGLAAVAWNLLHPQVYGSVPFKGLLLPVLAGLLVGSGTKVSNKRQTSREVAGEKHFCLEVLQRDFFIHRKLAVALLSCATSQFPSQLFSRARLRHAGDWVQFSASGTVETSKDSQKASARVG